MAREGLSSLVDLYNYQQDLSSSEAMSPVDLGGQESVTSSQSYHKPAVNTGGLFGKIGAFALGGVTGLGASFALDKIPGDAFTVENVHVNAKKNPDYFYNQVSDGFNNRLGVNRGQTLQDLYNSRGQISEDSQQNFSSIEDQLLGTQNEGTNFYKEINQNNLGKFQLLNRLEQAFGPGYRTNPAAQKILQGFDNIIAQKQDIGSLQSMIDAGKQVSDYLSSNEILAPARDYTRVV